MIRTPGPFDTPLGAEDVGDIIVVISLHYLDSSSD